MHSHHAIIRLDVRSGMARRKQTAPFLQNGEPLNVHYGTTTVQCLPDEVPGEESTGYHEPIAEDAEERAAGRHASDALGIGKAHLQPGRSMKGMTNRNTINGESLLPARTCSLRKCNTDEQITGMNCMMLEEEITGCVKQSRRNIAGS